MAARLDFVGDNRAIFDIAGNKHRLIVHVYEFDQNSFVSVGKPGCGSVSKKGLDRFEGGVVVSFLLHPRAAGEARPALR
jgi:HigB_toxin, RelE-like toxic component of a toxin-antitoxin system